MSEKEKKLVLTGGISFNDFKDTKPSNLVSQNTSNDMKGFTPIKDLFSDDKGKLQDNNTKNIQRNLDLINRLEYLIDNLEIEIEYNSNTDYIFDELIEIEKEHLKLLNERKEKPSIVEERRKNIERLKEEKKNVRQEQIKLHNLALSQNRNTSSISKINKKRKSNYVDFGKNKGQEISIPMGKSLKQSILDDNYKEKTKIIQRADAIYGSDEEYFKKFKPNKKVVKPEIIKPERREEDIPDIANAEKMFFPNGTLADMPLAKTIKNNIDKELEKEKDALFESLKNKKIGETDVKLDDIIPNLETYAQKSVHSKSTKELFYPSMRKASELETDIRLFQKLYPAIERRINEELKNKGYDEINLSKYLDKNIKNKEFYIEIIKLTKTLLKNKDLTNKLKDVDKLIKALDDNADEKIKTKKQEEILYSLLEDYLDGGVLSDLVASHIAKLPHTTNLLRLSGKDAELKKLYTSKAEIYSSPEELPTKYKELIIKKLKSQNISTNAKGFIFHTNSQLSQSISKSKDIKEYLKKVFKNIKASKNKNKPDKSLDFNTRDLHYAINKADIVNLQITTSGDITGDIIDIGDYNRGEDDLLVKTARKLQLEGKIEPKFLIVHFIVQKEDVDKILEEIKKDDKENKQGINAIN